MIPTCPGRRDVIAALIAAGCAGPLRGAAATARPAYVPLDRIREGAEVRIAWCGMPIFVRHRTHAEIAAARSVPLPLLRDPQRDEDRASDPRWIVLVGKCTHEGCMPLDHLGEYGGWLCLCHGSDFDTSGRIRKGPAPRNLAVPPHRFKGPGLLMIGSDMVCA